MEIHNVTFDQHQEVPAGTTVYRAFRPPATEYLKELKEENDSWMEFNYATYLWEPIRGEMVAIEDVPIDHVVVYVNSGYSGYQGGTHWWRCLRTK
jgi:hypothetical protein